MGHGIAYALRPPGSPVVPQYHKVGFERAESEDKTIHECVRRPSSSKGGGIVTCPGSGHIREPRCGTQKVGGPGGLAFPLARESSRKARERIARRRLAVGNVDDGDTGACVEAKPGNQGKVFRPGFRGNVENDGRTGELQRQLVAGSRARPESPVFSASRCHGKHGGNGKEQQGSSGHRGGTSGKKQRAGPAWGGTSPSRTVHDNPH